MIRLSSSHTDVAFVAVRIDLTGSRGKIFGGAAGPTTERGVLRAPREGVVLWRVIERAEVEKRMVSREIVPADDGLSVSYAYTVAGGDGGLMPIEEPGQFVCELVAAFAPPSFIPEVGKVEIITADAASGPSATQFRAVASPAQLEGRLIRLPRDIKDVATVWYVESGARRVLQTPTCGLLRFGDGWQRLVQPLPGVADLNLVPDGSTLTLAECAEGKIVASWPDTRTYIVDKGRRREILSDISLIERYGPHWRVKIVDLRPSELDLIVLGEPLT
jgi:hypothetical protein